MRVWCDTGLARRNRQPSLAYRMSPFVIEVRPINAPEFKGRPPLLVRQIGCLDIPARLAFVDGVQMLSQEHVPAIVDGILNCEGRIEPP